LAGFEIDAVGKGAAGIDGYAQAVTSSLSEE
jgi:hypothetical protein